MKRIHEGSFTSSRMKGASAGVSLRSVIRPVCSTVMAVILLGPPQAHTQAPEILRRQHFGNDHDAAVEPVARAAPADHCEPWRDERTRAHGARAPRACAIAHLDLPLAREMKHAYAAAASQRRRA